MFLEQSHYLNKFKQIFLWRKQTKVSRFVYNKTMIFEELNQAQSQAVKQTEGYVRIIAGAGSGKTRVLTSRYIYLVLEGQIHPDHILCLTFTNKAATEMRKRIKESIGENYNYDNITTYHSFCSKFLHQEGKYLGLKSNFPIINESKQKKILKKLCEEENLSFDSFIYEDLSKMIHDYKDGYDYVSALLSNRLENKYENRDKMKSLIIKYIKQCYYIEKGCDFDDLISFTLHILKNEEEVKQRWAERMNYIEVDEFQDTSNKEYEILELLQSVHHNLFIVGDPDQNIYEWRGSDNRLLVDFPLTHENTKTILLERNYRSSKNILKIANQLIKNNKVRVDKNLFTDKEDGKEVVYVHAYDDNNAALEISSLILNLRNEGYDYKDIAILYRANYLSEPLENRFRKDSIPYYVYGDVSFFQRIEIVDLFAYLKFLIFQDDESFLRIINKPDRKFTRSKVNYLKKLQSDSSLYDTLYSNRYDGFFEECDFRSFLKTTEDLRAQMKKYSLSELLERIASDYGYLSYLEEMGNPSRKENVSMLISLARESERANDLKEDALAFLQEFEMERVNMDQDHNQVKLMTIHASKGLEFPVVIVYGLNENVFPSKRTLEERDIAGLEEERRLFYVSITRAMERLYLYELQKNSWSENDESRFMEEILPLKEEYDDFSLPRKRSKKVLKEVKEEYFNPVFGKGKITKVNADGSFQVKFEDFQDEKVIQNSFFPEVVKKEEEKKEKPLLDELVEKQHQKEYEKRKEAFLKKKWNVQEDKHMSLKANGYLFEIEYIENMKLYLLIIDKQEKEAYLTLKECVQRAFEIQDK